MERKWIVISSVGLLLVCVQLASAGAPRPEEADVEGILVGSEPSPAAMPTAEPAAAVGSARGHEHPRSRSLPGASGWIFPVDGVDAKSVAGFFGDPRDGGSRSHEGVDIMAPQGTPVLAPATGRILEIGSRGNGGNVIWLQGDSGDTVFFFAHLDSHEVASGDRVEAGQRIGSVGNTGNAAATAPHLHFEIRGDAGAVDPLPLLERP